MEVCVIQPRSLPPREAAPTPKRAEMNSAANWERGNYSQLFNFSTTWRISSRFFSNTAKSAMINTPETMPAT